ncbi:hypothetical protein [Aliidiomarina soli]|uniref:Uncharacterized protein n=1 Tax=Aliidiomarina soli TaxID=1928574 RepID=A0A432WBW2_9GAMM|nr:hypothetical protein [Aliidiomarina soli]RUO29543.1 hypothetical protein CWE14_13855 [Aliidiomarina soli]
MDVSLIVALIGIMAGAAGYWIAMFWMQPILRYRSIRNRVHSDFIYYAQVVNADGLNEDMQKMYRERILANRKASTELSAAYLELPSWYTWWLEHHKFDPAKAAQHLIGYSNTREYDQAHKVQAAIRRLLGLPPET